MRVAEGPTALTGDGEGKMEESEGRDFIRIDVGIVKRSATGLDEGVDGRVGGTIYSSPCIRLVELVCDFARDAAVGISYLASLLFDGPADGGEGVPEPVAWDWLFSIRDDKDAFRTSFRWVDGGEGGLRPECDF